MHSAAPKAWEDLTPDEQMRRWDAEGRKPTARERRLGRMLAGAQAAVEPHLRAVSDPAPARPRTRPRTVFAADALWDTSFPPVAWLVPDILPPGLTLLAGAPKLGKSWLSLDICRAVSQGGACLGDRQCASGSVLYCALEDNPRTLRDRMKKSFPSKPGDRLTFWTEMDLLDRGGEEALRAWAEGADNPRLIVIDVLNKVRQAKAKDESPYSYDYRCVTPLKALADEFGLAIILVHHTRKAEAGDPLEKVSGTNGLTGAADATIVLDRSAEGVTLSGRGRELAEFQFAVQLDPDTCRWQVMGDAAEVRRSSERSAIVSALRQADEPMTPADISAETGQSSVNVRQLLPKMVRDGEVTKVSRGLYRVPDFSPHHIGHNDHDGGGVG